MTGDVKGMADALSKLSIQGMKVEIVPDYQQKVGFVDNIGTMLSQGTLREIMDEKAGIASDADPNKQIIAKALTAIF